VLTRFAMKKDLYFFPYGKGKSEAGYAKVIKARDRDKFFLNSKISMWDINRNGLYQDIFDGLPGAEQDKFKSRVVGGRQSR
jgi:aryl-alcohol dehydrogenase-like predicted oxidoreductase